MEALPIPDVILKIIVQFHILPAMPVQLLPGMHPYIMEVLPDKVSLHNGGTACKVSWVMESNLYTSGIACALSPWHISSHYGGTACT
eukprot:223414-Pelagomonas_calceolata.AAC.8